MSIVLGASEGLAGWITTGNRLGYDSRNIVRARPCYEVHREAKRKIEKGEVLAGVFFSEKLLSFLGNSPLPVRASKKLLAKNN